MTDLRNPKIDPNANLKKIDSINIDCDYEKVKGFTSMKPIELSSTNINRLIKKTYVIFCVTIIKFEKVQKKNQKKCSVESIPNELKSNSNVLLFDIRKLTRITVMVAFQREMEHFQLIVYGLGLFRNCLDGIEWFITVTNTLVLITFHFIQQWRMTRRILNWSLQEDGKLRMENVLVECLMPF